MPKAIQAGIDDAGMEYCAGGTMRHWTIITSRRGKAQHKLGGLPPLHQQNAMALILYSRHECGLCDEAIEQLELAGLADQLQVVHIDDDLTLLQRYGTRIPVLRHPPSDQELSWPFSIAQVEALLHD